MAKFTNARSRTVSQARLALLAAAIAATPSLAHAQTVYTYTGGATAAAPASGAFSSPGSFTPAGPPASAATTELDFGGSDPGTYTATNDVGPFTLNRLVLNGTATGVETIAPAAAANVFTFVTNGATTPTLVQNGTGGFNLATGLTVTNTLNLTGTGTGNVLLAGPVTGSASIVTSLPSVTVGGAVSLTTTNTSNGAFNIGSGVVTFAPASTFAGSFIDVGSASGRTAVLNINSTGAINLPGQGANGFGTLNVAEPGANGAVNQTAGTINAITTGGNGNYVMIADGANTYGSYTITGGSLTAGSATTAVNQGIRVGGTNTANQTTALGVFNIAGTGAVTSYRYFAIGTGGTGVVTATGGTATVIGYRTNVGDAGGGVATLNIGTEAGGSTVFTTGSALTGGGTASLDILSSATAASATVNLNAGTLFVQPSAAIPGIAQGNALPAGATAVLNLNGGTVASNATTGVLIASTNSLPVRVFNGGVTFNQSTVTTSNTLTANLQNTAGNGIYVAGGVIPVSAGTGGGGAGYIGSPVVTVTGGGGTGATAIANVVNGVVTGVTITNPGQNYSAGSALTFAFAGGGATSNASSFTVAPDAYLAANGTGGITKTGPGTLSLSGANTYGGTTTVSAGVLNPTLTVSLPNFATAGKVAVAAGATLDLSVGGTGQFTAANLDTFLGNGTLAAGAILGIDTTAASLAYATNVTQPVGLAKYGTNTLTLTGANTYNGGTAAFGGTLAFNQGSLGTGPVNLSGGTLVYPTGDTAPEDLTAAGRTLTIGAGNGTINLSGNTVAYAGNVLGTGALTLTGGGSLSLAGSYNSSGTGNVAVGGGTTLTLPAPANVLLSSTGQLFVGDTTNGTLNVSGGTLSAANFVGIGRTNGTGVLNLSAGSVTSTATPATGAFVTLGSVGTSSNGTVNQTGGTYAAVSTTVGETGTGTYTISGGSATSGVVNLAPNAGATGTLNLNGGVFNTNAITRGAGTGNVNFNGGTLRVAPGGSNAFVTSVTGVVLAGGAIFDTNGQSMAVQAQLNNNGGPDGGVTKVGAGTLTLSNTNGYLGGTNVSAGTVVAAAAGALGSGPVTLSGGSLTLAAPQLSAFNGFTLTKGGASTTGGPTVGSAGQILTLTDNGGNEGNSSFFPTAQTLVGRNFTAAFTFTPSGNKAADGVAFVIENDPRGASAVGGTGGALGYGGTTGFITNSFAAELNIYTPQTVGTEFGTNGTVLTPFNVSTGVALASGDPINVALSYNAATGTVTETVTDAITAATLAAPLTTTINLAALLNGNTGYVGFTGATGGATATQTISNFTFTSGGAAPVAINNPVTVAANTASTVAVATNGLSATTPAVGAITVNAGATLSVATAAGSTGRAVLGTTGVTVAAGGKLDVAGNDLVVQNGSLSAVSALAAAGYANGAMTGSGIVSSTAAANARHTTTVGVIVNNDGSGNQLFGNGTTLGLFDGTNPGSNDVLVKYTYFGDANLDGKIDGADYTRIDAGYAAGGSAMTGWYNGDFNYDGKVDGSDYTLIDNAFNLQGVPLVTPLGVATATAEIAPAGGTAAVPEPAALGLLIAAATAGLARRRRMA